MANYIDGFVLPVSRDRLDAYRLLVEAAADFGRHTARSNTGNMSATT